jgi:hypothetical protein
MRTIIRTFRWIATGTLGMTLLVTAALACSCAVLSICELVEQSDVIFLGEVIEGGLNPGEDAWSGRPTSARLRIIEPYKGLPSGTREVTVSLGYIPGMCSAAVYRRGERTLAFLYNSGGNILRDGGCSGSRFAKDTPEDLQYVRDYFAGKTQTTIRGRIGANSVSDYLSGPPVPGAQVKAQRGSSSFVATANARGEYAISGIPAGSYRVTAEKAGYTRAAPEDPEPPSLEVTVRGRGCAIRNLGLWSTNSVKGVVRDVAGKVVARLPIFLQELGVDEWGEQDVTNDRGEFEFKQVDPGRHYLAVSPFGATADSPYEPRFLGPLNVEATSQLQSLNLQLGVRLPVRTLTILPEWPDGKRVSDAFVLCGDARVKSDAIRYFDSAEPNAAEVLVCRALADRPYRVRVTRLERTMDLRDTPEVVVPAGTKDTDVRIRVGPRDAAASRR